MYKQIKASGGDLALPGQIVSVSYTASVLSTGRVISGSRWRTGQRTDSFVVGEPPDTSWMAKRDFAWGPPSRCNELVPLLQEAVDGMRVGEQRRVSIPPASGFARLADETVQLELELIGTKKGPGALVFRIEEAWKTLNVGPFVILTVLVLYGGTF